MANSVALRSSAPSAVAESAPLANAAPSNAAAPTQGTGLLPRLPHGVREFFGLPAFIGGMPPPAANGVSTRAVVNVASAGPQPLRRGDRGERVAELQSLLREAGFFYGDANGVFERTTERAVIDFQAAYIGTDGEQLRIDGVAGQTTIDALRLRKKIVDARRAAGAQQDETEPVKVTPDFEHLGEVQVLGPGSHGIEVERAQALLRNLGYVLQQTGQYDEVTQAAVADFQGRYTRLTRTWIEADGKVGAMTGFAMSQAAESTRESPMTWLDFSRRVEAQMVQQPTLPAPSTTTPAPTPNSSVTNLSAPFLKAGSTNTAAVIDLQNQLRSLGYDITADGVFGNGTTAALTDFQRLYSLFTGEPLSADGTCGDSTRAALATAASTSLMQRLPATLRKGTVAIGYQHGVPQTIIIRDLGDGGRLETRAALAYYAMRATAPTSAEFKAGESFRTMQYQQTLYHRYRKSPNRAARPGYSTHQSGIAIDTADVNTTGSTWLRTNGRAFGFVLPGYVYTTPNGERAVEEWHWEYRVDRLPNRARQFYGLPTLAEDPTPTTPPASRRRRKRSLSSKARTTRS